MIKAREENSDREKKRRKKAREEEENKLREEGEGQKREERTVRTCSWREVQGHRILLKVPAVGSHAYYCAFFLY